MLFKIHFSQANQPLTRPHSARCEREKKEREIERKKQFEMALEI